jgi:DNA modification methylase
MDIKAVNQVVTDKYAIYNGDSCEIMPALPSESIGYSLHSPPFEGLYKFSNSDRDLSNSRGDDFFTHYKFIIKELLRMTKQGRLASVHCTQLPTAKSRDGYIGLRDLRGEIVKAFQECGWYYTSEVCIWKDPGVAMTRTKSIRLLHKQAEKDSAVSGQALADYILTFRKPEENLEPIKGKFEYFIGEDENAPEPIESMLGRMSEAEARKWYSVNVWNRYASPVWMDIRATRTLQYRGGRDERDEQHISPLQMDVVERCIHLWSNPNDVVFTPFLGIGSEVYGAVNLGRRGIGIELKPSYFSQAVKNLDSLKDKQNGFI